MADGEGSAGSNPPPADRAAIEAMVAAAIEALERGEPDPLPAVCRERPDLQSRVQRRLAQLAERGLIPAPVIVRPDTIGPYRVVRELGSGGMGSVYLAEQSEPVRRQVALKVIKLGMDTREVVARFQAERQALAQMNHPHIAQVFDAGITPEGRPFFAMEFVAGEVLTTFCAARALPIEARVQLLATIARAVQHAHDRGFVHRDLKPTNVLVAEHDGVFMPKIIDFGVAKAVVADDTDGALRTRDDQVLGTPEYMSPEQACSGGRDVDARTDVYALGAVLYELLCGELPFESRRLRQASRLELERMLQDELPVAPSRRLGAHGTVGTALRRRLAGELDWITLKALAKERERRYASALALAEDLERWLRDEPVRAGPPTRTYRLRKFVRRNRTAVGAVLAAVVLTGGGWWLFHSRSADAEATTVRAQQEAEQHYREARVAVDRLLARATDERMRRASQNDGMRQNLVADALAFYDRWLRERPDDPHLRADRIDALILLSQVHWQMGQVADAETTAQEAVTEARRLYAEAPDDLSRRALLAEATRRLGRAIYSARQDEAAARALFEESVGHFAACFEAAPQGRARSYSSALRELASVRRGRDDAAARLDLLQRSVAAIERLQTLGALDATAAHDLAIARTSLAQQLMADDRLEAAEAVLAQVERDLPQLRGEWARIEALVQQARGRIAQRRGDAAAAGRAFTAMVAAGEQWCRDEPGRMQPGDALVGLLGELAAHHERTGAFAAADDVRRRLIEVCASLVDAFPGDAARVRDLADTLHNSAKSLWDRYRRSDLDLAQTWARRACEVRDGIAAPDALTMPRWCFAMQVACIAEARGESSEAIWERIATELPTEAPASSAIAQLAVDAGSGIAASRLRTGRVDAVATALAAAEHLAERLPADDKRASVFAWLHARLELLRRDGLAAAAAAERLVRVRDTWFGWWHAGDCLFAAAELDPAGEHATAWRQRAAELFTKVTDDLAADVARDAADPWQSVPWGFSSVQLARIAAANGDDVAARRHLAAAMPVLEGVQAAAHRDVWQADVFAAGQELRTRLERR